MARSSAICMPVTASTSRRTARSLVIFLRRASASKTALTSRAASKSIQPNRKPPQINGRKTPVGEFAWASFFELYLLSARVPLLLPRITVRVISVALPEAQPVVIQHHESAHPLHAFPRIEVRHDQPQWPSMFRCQRLAIVFEREQHIRLNQIRQRHICRVS